MSNHVLIEAEIPGVKFVVFKKKQNHGYRFFLLKKNHNKESYITRITSSMYSEMNKLGDIELFSYFYSVINRAYDNNRLRKCYKRHKKL